MRRIVRWVWLIAAGICGLATVAVGVLWVRSYGAAEALQYRGDRAHVMLLSVEGGLFFWDDYYADRVAYSGPQRWEYQRGHFDSLWLFFQPRIESRWGWYIHNYANGKATYLDIQCPHWAVLLPLLLVDAWLVRRGVVRWRRRWRAGYCRQCGYNLTGNVSGVCPECGTATPAAVRVGHPPASV